MAAIIIGTPALKNRDSIIRLLVLIHPQDGHTSALLLISLLHSGHLIKDIVFYKKLSIHIWRDLNQPNQGNDEVAQTVHMDAVMIEKQVAIKVAKRLVDIRQRCVFF